MSAQIQWQSGTPEEEGEYIIAYRWLRTNTTGTGFFYRGQWFADESCDKDLDHLNIYRYAEMPEAPAFSQEAA